MWNVLSCEARRKTGSGECQPHSGHSWMLYWEGDSLLSSLPGLEISLLVCCVKHLERWICVCFSVKDYVLLTMTKTHLEWLTQKGSIYFLSLLGHTVWHGRILVPRPGIKPAPPSLEVENFNQWTTKEVLCHIFKILISNLVKSNLKNHPSQSALSSKISCMLKT